MEQFPDWQYVLVWSSVISVVVVLACLIAIPWVVCRLPVDYFSSSRRKMLESATNATWLSRAIDTIKNLIGFVFVVLGAIMLVTPGQGVLTILVGLLLMNFPGKYRVERWLVMRPGVMRGLNWLRSRRGMAPFVFSGVDVSVDSVTPRSSDHDSDAGGSG